MIDIIIANPLIKSLLELCCGCCVVWFVFSAILLYFELRRAPTLPVPYSYTVSNYVAGKMRIKSGSYIGPWRDAAGTYTDHIPADDFYSQPPIVQTDPDFISEMTL